MDPLTWQHASARIRVEYVEMPDLKLTLRQIRRLCDLPDELCTNVVAELVRSGFLWRTVEGKFLRCGPTE